MKLKEVKELVWKHSEKPLQNYGFQAKATKSFDLVIEKKRTNGFDSMGMNYNCYGDTYVFLMG